MANNLKHPLEDPPSSSTGEKEIESEEEEETIISSEEEDEEETPPRSGSKEDDFGSSESQLTGRKRLSTNVASSNVAKKVYTQQGGKMGTNRLPPCTRLFSEKDEIVLLQGLIDSQGNNNPFEDRRPLYESMKASFSFDVTWAQFKKKIWSLKRKYTRTEMRGGVASFFRNPHEKRCFQLSKAIWGAVESDESERGLSKKQRDLVTPLKGRNNAQEGDMKKKKKSRLVVEKESADWDDESAFFLGMDFLKAKWTKVPPTESKKETQEKMKKLYASELECQKFEEMLKAMKNKCAHAKVELLNEVTSLIMAAD
ncbi:probable transcription factor At1g66420 [Raphanus sativus]|uniref:Probable transcription factor At1g66420 n=1 Tax=Raphanus sativus TaxID=3726 RepID=A0A6J0N846_RAPSA|nr:probable transcription factor At1g66420 [Raphanus sativus]